MNIYLQNYVAFYYIKVQKYNSLNQDYFEIIGLRNQNKALKIENDKLKNENTKLKNEIQILKKENDNLKIKFDINKKLDEKMKIIDDLISKIKSYVVDPNIYSSVELSSREKFIAINFISDDKRINHSIICKNKAKFVDIERELYLKYPEYSKNYNYLMLNGFNINRLKSLEENGIHGYTIVLNKIDN